MIRIKKDNRLTISELKIGLSRATHCKITFYDKEKEENLWVKIVHVDYEDNSIIGYVAQAPLVVKTIKQFQRISLFFREIKELYTEEL